ncbi:NTP transferase domain-containing protein [uncultured Hymenobacter sp.]|uniref:NTP transferase domain-containing protein n=1 Tax=uncultured Hymenobacter sp. TaxID=170016 RepID=UPI0035C99D2D
MSDIISKKTKHAALARPDLGEFGRHELAFLGAPCGLIQQLARELAHRLSPALRVAYVDADHAGHDQETAAQMMAPGFAESAFSAELTDKISFRQLNLRRGLDRFSQPELLAHESLVLVNGNHFRARQQVIILDPRKPLERKLDRLTEVQLILLTDSQTELPNYLRAHLAATGRPLPPQRRLNDVAGIADWLRGWYAAAVPPLRGLVLAGGLSQRMQTDKSRLRYPGRPEQRAHAAALLGAVCQDVHISGRPEQLADLPASLTPLPDKLLGLGPVGGLLTAFQTDPNAAWLVLACDLPFLTADTLEFLVRHRQPGRAATAFQSPRDEFPEPLITIWEPRSYATLLRFLSLGYSCPRKALINSDIELLQAPRPDELRNINTPAERQAAERELSGS